MSLASWIEEFVPLEIDEIKPQDASYYALLKWMGTLPQNLKRHHCVWNPETREVIELMEDEPYPELLDTKSLPTTVLAKVRHNEVFEFDAHSCTLCHLIQSALTCDGCRLYDIRGGVRCDKARPNEVCSPYDDNILMIKWLQLLYDYEQLCGPDDWDYYNE